MQLAKSVICLYVGPSLSIVSVKATSTDAGGDGSAEATLLVAEGLVGYAWYWNSFNIMLGGGIRLPLGASKITVKSSNGSYEKSASIGAGLDLEGSLGWTF